MRGIFNVKNYNPDILETIANLSNDEVFTPPKLANDVLDMLPKEIWSDSSITFLDPAVKTGIFLREVASRLIDGLAEEIPDLQERVNHILTKQVFGLGITELTTLMSRRTVYCSMYANGDKSICTEFEDEKGNILFPDTKHNFNKNGRCVCCGASEETYGDKGILDNHAYSFIHDDIEEVFGDMKFDVIIGNPPYQLNMGNKGGNSSRSSAIYNLFVDKAIELNPKYISMIIPSRWMSGFPEGISRNWVLKMINCNKFRVIHDFENANSLFSDVGINGGVNYFLWDREYNGKCAYNYHHEGGKKIAEERKLNSLETDSIIRDPIFNSVVQKTLKVDGRYFADPKDNFSGYVSSQLFFGNMETLTSNWRDYKHEKDDINNIKYYVSKATNEIDYGWINESQIHKNIESLNIHKIYIPSAHGGQSQVLGQPRYGEPNSVCSQTYLVVGYDPKKHNFTKKECLNIMSYIKTKFFRFMVKVRKNTQNGPRGVYQFVPLQDFSKSWTDEELYEKYELTQEEIDYIEDNIAPMD